MWAQFSNISLACLSGRAMGRYKRTAVKNPLANTYLCKDGQWIGLSETPIPEILVPVL